MEVDEEEFVTVPRKSEKLEIQSDGVNLCFIGKRGIEAEDEGFISDSLERSSSNGGMHVFGKQLSFQNQSCVPVIQEIDSQDVADLHKELPLYDSANNPTETDLHISCSVNAASSRKLMKEEEDSGNSLTCKFCASIWFVQVYCTVL